MTYAQYHLAFIVPVLALLLLTTARRRGPLAGVLNADDRWTRGWLLGLVLVAFTYTTPWDNYLVFKEIWSYPPERVLGRLGYVPYEEYAFFILQTVITGLWTLWLLRRESHISTPAAPVVRWGGAAFLLAISLFGVWCLQQESTFYLGLILAWAYPVLAGQWAFGGDLVLSNARLFLLATLPPTLYLWLTDAYAIYDGIWHISERYTVGLYVGPLPLEEMLFFLTTNLLVVTGLLLFLHPESGQRLARGWPALGRKLGIAPQMTGAGVAVRRGGDVLLVRRADNGLWDVPGGRQEGVETPAQTARRKLLEETGLSVGQLSALGVWEHRHAYPDGNIVDWSTHVFMAEYEAGTARAGDDASETRWWPLDGLPQPMSAITRSYLTALTEAAGPSTVGPTS